MYFASFQWVNLSTYIIKVIIIELVFLPVGMATTRGEDTSGKYCPQELRIRQLTEQTSLANDREREISLETSLRMYNTL